MIVYCHWPVVCPESDCQGNCPIVRDHAHLPELRPARSPNASLCGRMSKGLHHTHSPPLTTHSHSDSPDPLFQKKRVLKANFKVPKPTIKCRWATSESAWEFFYQKSPTCHQERPNECKFTLLQPKETQWNPSNPDTVGTHYWWPDYLGVPFSGGY